MLQEEALALFRVFGNLWRCSYDYRCWRRRNHSRDVRVSRSACLPHYSL